GRADVSLTEKQGEVRNGWVRSPGRVAGNELDYQRDPPNMPEGAGRAIVEQKCTQCHFLWRMTQQRWSHDNWEKKIAWMRERIHDKRGAVVLTDEEAKIGTDYLAAKYSLDAPRAHPNALFARTPLQAASTRYIRA